MGKIIIVANRLPVTAKKDGDKIEYIESIGGLTTGLKTYHEQAGSIWAGWPGIADEELTDEERSEMKETLQNRYKCAPIFMSQEELDKFYYGFCNETIWPLFHYLSTRATYDNETWEYYKKINERFFESIRPHIENDDIIWVHDYQLMLLPEMIRKEFPYVKTGFFLHIPFPSFEVFRQLPWREEIINGLLGADLIGFHTYDYVRHFFSCTRRLMGLDDSLNVISTDDRNVRVDSFPMGIDYDRFADSPEVTEGSEEVSEYVKLKDTMNILSVDRLDYTKGIPERIKAYGRFLNMFPEYKGKVRLNLIVAPSRVAIDQYGALLREIEELVSQVNSTYGTFNWMPVWFRFKSFPQSEMITFYRHSDALLVTPLRDGMNLVAKEYIASRSDRGGMVVISETAGAASELAEAVIVNANDQESIARGIYTALSMSDEEKKARNDILHKRLRRYNVQFWANDFLTSLKKTAKADMQTSVPMHVSDNIEYIKEAYAKAKRRILCFDYDGTLVGSKPIPSQARPDEKLKDQLRRLIADPGNIVSIVSGRDREVFDDWFGDVKGMHFVAAHGLWIKNPGMEWNMTASLDNEWKDSIRPMLQMYSDRMPGSLIEEKEFALSLHYRRCDPDMAAQKINELKMALQSMTETSTLSLQEGSKVLEVKDIKVNKGVIASLLIKANDFDFILGAGDDLTDEDLFESLPEGAFSVKVGKGETAARYRIRSWQAMRAMIDDFADISDRGRY